MKRLNLILCTWMLAFSSLFAADGNLQIINLSADTSMNLVSVSLEDSVIIDTLAFNEASAYLLIPEGNNQTLTFTAIDSPFVQFELNSLDIVAGGFYQSILYGVLNPLDYADNPEGISLDLNASWSEKDTANIASSDIRIDFFHAVSDVVELDVAEIDLSYIVDNMSYGEYSNSTNDIEKTERQLFVTSTDRSVTIASKTLDLEGFSGKTATVFFSGFIVPSDNNNGPVVNYFSVDELGNVEELEVLSSPTSILDNILTQLEVYPNPASDFVRLAFNNSVLSNISLQLIDINGRTHQHQRYDLQYGFNTIDLSFNTIATGLYFLQIEAMEGVKSIPLLIQQ